MMDGINFYEHLLKKREQFWIWDVGLENLYGDF